MSNYIEWRDVPGYEGVYQVSDTGLVRSRNKKPDYITLKPLTKGKGYLFVFLCKDGTSRQLGISAIVMLAFVGERPAGMVINHKNGIKTDNRLSNLEYCTSSQNTQHARDVLHVRQAKGEEISQSKLTGTQVREMRRLRESGATYVQISLLFGVTEVTAREAVTRQTWKHIE